MGPSCPDLSRLAEVVEHASLAWITIGPSDPPQLPGSQPPDTQELSGIVADLARLGHTAEEIAAYFREERPVITPPRGAPKESAAES